MISTPMLLLVAPVEGTGVDCTDAVRQALARALLQVFNGDRAGLQSAIAELAGDEREAVQGDSLHGGLTPRQLEVLRLVVRGRTNQQIASVLSISQNTVARHVANIYEKTGVHNRVALATYAINRDLTPGSDETR